MCIEPRDLNLNFYEYEIFVFIKDRYNTKH